MNDGEGGGARASEEDKESRAGEKGDKGDRTCRLARRCVAWGYRGPVCAPAAAARCFTMKQKGGGVGGRGRERGRAGERRRSSPCEARGHSRLCKPYRSAHYLAARRLSNNIMVQRHSARPIRGAALEMHTYTRADICARRTYTEREREREWDWQRGETGGIRCGG